MRTFLILLLLTNLGYLIWQQGWFARQEPLVADEKPGFQQAEQGLVLLSELAPERLALMDSLAQARTARQGAQDQLQQLQEEVAAVEGQIGEVQEELQQDQERSTEVQQALLDTLDAAVVTADDASGASVVAPVPWCAMVGAFADPKAATDFVNSLPALGAEGVVVLRQEPVSSTWWVHMPAFASEALAREMLAELQAKNIDSYYMRSGEMAGGISLGVYSRRESALIAQQQLADQGYATGLREVFRTGDRPYVQVNMADGARREAPEWRAFLSSAGAAEVSENACETIASENQFP